MPPQDDTGTPGGKPNDGLGDLLDPHVDPSKPPRKTAAKKTTAKRTTTPRASRSGQRTGGGTRGKSVVRDGISLNQFLWAISQRESGDYGAVNPDSGALGKYQVLPSNVASWSQQALGRSITPDQFLHSPALQEKIVRHVLGHYFREYGPAGAASAWYSGSPDNMNSTASQGGYPSVSQYVNDVLGLAGKAPDHIKGHGGVYGGSSYTGGSQFDTPRPLSVNEYLDDPQVSEKYGYLTAYLHNPEIGPILAKAAKQGWGANQLLGALVKTDWWQKKSQSARAWQAQQRLDPATADQRLHQMVRQVQTLAQSTLGFRLDDDRAAHLANTAIAGDWSAQDLQHAVGAEFHYKASQDAYKGAAGQTLNTLKQMSSAYLVPMSNHTLDRWTRKVLEGVYQPQDFQNRMVEMAKSLYPTLGAALDKGETVQDYLNPYAELAAQTLEISPDQIDWFHPKWAKALNTTTEDGKRAPMSLSDWASYLRGLPDYKHTQGAAEQAASFALNLAQTWGKVAV